jgi:hypothetical protein
MNRRSIHHQADIIGCLEFKKLKMGAGEWCFTEHETQLDTKKFAAHAMYILGLPVGFVCVSCKKEMVKVWKELSPIEYI